jgi:hypothetical protein
VPVRRDAPHIDPEPISSRNDFAPGNDEDNSEPQRPKKPPTKTTTTTMG